MSRELTDAEVKALTELSYKKSTKKGNKMSKELEAQSKLNENEAIVFDMIRTKFQTQKTTLYDKNGKVICDKIINDESGHVYLNLEFTITEFNLFKETLKR